jgi:predicted nucleic acid-binding Zn ribbon protein
MGVVDAMTNETGGRPDTNPHCWSCQAEIASGDRFCRACGEIVTAGAKESRETLKKRGRKHAAIMLLFGAATVLFAVIHRNPADVILVVAFGLPLCGAGAVTWRMA